MTSLCPPTRCGNVFTFPHPLQLPGRRDSNLPKAQRTTLGQGHFSFLILSLLPSSPLLFPNHPSSSSLPSSPLTPLSSLVFCSPFLSFCLFFCPLPSTPCLSSLIFCFHFLFFHVLSTALLFPQPSPSATFPPFFVHPLFRPLLVRTTTSLLCLLSPHSPFVLLSSRFFHMCGTH